MKNLFSKEDTKEILNRIDLLSNTTQQKWGKMNTAQMFAHCNVAYKAVYEPNSFKKPNPIVKFMLKTFVKPIVVGKKPYKKNSKTAPQFIISEKKDFEFEKQQLVENIIKTQKLGPTYFEGKESQSFGKLNSDEWNSLFSKHLNHHLEQFGV